MIVISRAGNHFPKEYFEDPDTRDALRYAREVAGTGLPWLMES
jgi:hypothetical protein